MKAKTIYETKDGSRFDTAQEAKRAEAIIAAVKDACELLGKPHPDVQDGKGWIQHSELAVRLFKRALLKIAAPLFDGYPKIEAQIAKNADAVHAGSIVGRIINDNAYGNGSKWGALDRAWNRLACIDKQAREHQQPFFALNGPDSRHYCVEDRS